MAARRPKPTTERLSPTLTREARDDRSNFRYRYVFSGEFLVECPRHGQMVTIEDVSLWMQLSCGCRWFPPEGRVVKKGDGGWVSFGQEDRKDA